MLSGLKRTEAVMEKCSRFYQDDTGACGGTDQNALRYNSADGHVGLDNRLATSCSARASMPTPRRASCRHWASDTPILGENVLVDPPRRLVQTFRALWSDAAKAEGTSRVTWEIEPVGDSCRLLVTHDQLRENASAELYGGWMMILSGLKTLLETGELLTTPGSLRWAAAQTAA